MSQSKFVNEMLFFVFFIKIKTLVKVLPNISSPASKVKNDVKYIENKQNLVEHKNKGELDVVSLDSLINIKTCLPIEYLPIKKSNTLCLPIEHQTSGPSARRSSSPRFVVSRDYS